MALGFLIGAIQIPIPGIGKIAVGLSGVLIVALILGNLRRTGGMNWTIPLSANLVLRNLGLTLFLAQVGMASGPKFAATVTETGFMMLGLGAIVLVALVLPILVLGLLVFKMPYDEVAGIVSGACGNPAILAYSNKLTPTDRPDIAYAMIFPGMTIVKIVFVDIVPALVMTARAPSGIKGLSCSARAHWIPLQRQASHCLTRTAREGRYMRRSSRLIAVAMCAALALTAAAQQPPPAPPPQAPPLPAASGKTFSQGELDQLLAPIALYPDALLAQVLMASTYPLEVVEAARWVKANPIAQGQGARGRAAEAAVGPGVKSLAVFPQVLDDDEREARLDAEARRRVPRAAEGRARHRAGAARRRRRRRARSRTRRSRRS